MRKLTAVSLITTCLLTAAAPARAYYDDTHYSFTYYMARACGYTPLQAYRLASACLSIDYCEKTEPNQYGNVFSPRAAADSSQLPRVWFHAFMYSTKYPNCLKDDNQRERASVEILNRRDQFWEQAKPSGNPGAFLHFLQDMTSHWGYSSWGGHWASWGAHTNSKPLGPTCDFLAYQSREDHFEMINNTIEYLTRFMTEVGKQKTNFRTRGEVLRVLDGLRDANPAPRPLGAADALLLGLALSGQKPALVLSADRVATLKGGPDMEKANAVIVNALKAWGELEWTVDEDAPESTRTIFPTRHIPYEFDAGGKLAPASQRDRWVLYGNLRVVLEGARNAGTARVAVRLAPTRSGESETEIATQTVTLSGKPVEFASVPVGDVIVEVAAGEAAAQRKRVRIDKESNEVSFRLAPAEASPPAAPPQLVLIEHAAAPTEGDPGSRFVLQVSYRVVSRQSAVTVTESARVSGPSQLAVPNSPRTTRSLALYNHKGLATFEVTPMVPGDYVCDYEITAAGATPLRGRIPFRVKEPLFPILLMKGNAPKVDPSLAQREQKETTFSYSAQHFHEHRRSTFRFSDGTRKLVYDWVFNYTFNRLPPVLKPGDTFELDLVGGAGGEKMERDSFAVTRSLPVLYPSHVKTTQRSGDTVLGKTESDKVYTKCRMTIRFIVPEIGFYIKIGDVVEYVYERRMATRKERDDLLAGLINTPTRDPGATYESAPLGESVAATTPGLQESSPALQPYQRARQLYAQKQFTEAEREVRSAIRLVPDEAVLHNYLGLVLSGERKHAEAEQSYREAARRKPDMALYSGNLAIALVAQGKWAEAERAARAALQIDAGHASAHNALAVALLGLDRADEALRSANEAVRLKPTVAEYHNSRGLALSKLQKLPQAEAAYREAAQLNPAVSAYPRNLGIALHNQKKYSEAEIALREAVRLSPAEGKFHADLAGALLGQSKRDEALREAREALRLGHKDHWVYKSLGL